MLAGLLTLIAIAVLAMGYRYFARLTIIELFDSPDSARFPDHRQVWLYLGHHVSVTAGSTAVIGAGIASYWGWAPAYLWIVVGSAVLGGVFAMGTLWLCRETGETDPALIAARYVKGAISLPIYALLAMMLICLAPVFIGVIQGILTAYPGSIWPFALLTPLALLCGSVARRQSSAAVVAFFIVVVIVLLAVCYVGTYYPMTFASSLTVIVADNPLLVLGHNEFWLVLILFLGFFGAGQSLSRLAQPRGVLILIQIIALVALLVVALFLVNPDMAAQAYRPEPEVAILPWLPLLVTGGACAAFHAIIAGTSLTLKPAVVEPRLGYLPAALDAVLAVLIVVAATSAGTFESLLAEWPHTVALDQWPIAFVEHVAGFAEVIGISATWTAAFVAFLVSALALAALEVCIGILHYFTGELGEKAGLTSIGKHGRLAVFVVVVAAYYVLDGLRGGTDGWQFVGVLVQMFVGALLVVCVLAARRRKPVSSLLAVPGFALIAIALWGIAVQLPETWNHDQPFWATVDVFVIVIGAWLAIALGRSMAGPAAAEGEAAEAEARAESR